MITLNPAGAKASNQHFLPLTRRWGFRAPRPRVARPHCLGAAVYYLASQAATLCPTSRRYENFRIGLRPFRKLPKAQTNYMFPPRHSYGAWTFCLERYLRGSLCRSAPVDYWIFFTRSTGS
jgi:hypothetical protein